MKKILSAYSKLLYRARRWIYFAAGLGLVWILAGIAIVTNYPETFPQFMELLRSTFRESLGDIGQLSGLSLARALLVQNSTASFYNLALGVIFGLVPALSSAVNFFVFGYLLGAFSAPALDGNLPGSVGIFWLAVLPHGIFEIPAFILSVAFGFRLGWAWILPGPGNKRWPVFKESLLDVLRIAPVIAVLLVIAALVEAFVTPLLV